jgi:hypothetical protein
MERSVAIKTLGKLLGKSLGYRIDPKAATREEREAARAALTPAIEERKKLEEQKNARCRAVLAADAEYQSLCAAYELSRKETDRLGSITRHYKITVGTTTSMFFHVRAEGDSWEEVIDKLTKKEAA